MVTKEGFREGFPRERSRVEFPKFRIKISKKGFRVEQPRKISDKGFYGGFPRRLPAGKERRSRCSRSDSERGFTVRRSHYADSTKATSQMVYKP